VVFKFLHILFRKKYRKNIFIIFRFYNYGGYNLLFKRLKNPQKNISCLKSIKNEKGSKKKT